MAPVVTIAPKSMGRVKVPCCATLVVEVVVAEEEEEEEEDEEEEDEDKDEDGVETVVAGFNVCTRPPIRSRPSNTITLYPKNVKWRAHANPDTPAPMTIIVF